MNKNKKSTPPMHVCDYSKIDMYANCQDHAKFLSSNKKRQRKTQQNYIVFQFSAFFFVTIVIAHVNLNERLFGIFRDVIMIFL